MKVILDMAALFPQEQIQLNGRIRCRLGALVLFSLIGCFWGKGAFAADEAIKATAELRARIASMNDQDQVVKILSDNVLAENLPNELRANAILVCGKYKDERINALLLKCINGQCGSANSSVSDSVIKAFYMIGESATYRVLEALKKAVSDGEEENVKYNLVRALNATLGTPGGSEKWGRENLDKLDPAVSNTIREYGTHF